MITLLTFLFTFNLAQAEWVEDHINYEHETSDPKDMASALTLFQEALNYLNADNLTSGTKITVKRFYGKIATYRWRNDADCEVKDPSIIQAERISSAKVEFVYETKPSQMYMLESITMKPTPCSTRPVPPPPKISVRAL